MEDAATAEIARSQVWQWIRHGATLDDRTARHPRARPPLRGRRSSSASATRSATTVVRAQGRPRESRALFEQVALGEEFVEFLTPPAYEHLD